MDIQIVTNQKTAHGFYFEGVCGKVTASVGITKHGLQVLCKNASHRAWRGGGKHFHTVQDALANYRSSEMKAIIRAAVEIAGDAS
jgi:hypothetical protein